MKIYKEKTSGLSTINDIVNGFINDTSIKDEIYRYSFYTDIQNTSYESLLKDGTPGLIFSGNCFNLLSDLRNYYPSTCFYAAKDIIMIESLKDIFSPDDIADNILTEGDISYSLSRLSDNWSIYFINGIPLAAIYTVDINDNYHKIVILAYKKLICNSFIHPYIKSLSVDTFCSILKNNFNDNIEEYLFLKDMEADFE